MAVGSALGGWIYPTFGYAAMLAFSILLVVGGLGSLAYSIRTSEKQKNNLKPTTSPVLVPAFVEYKSVKGDLI
jgi:hypothetical protein